MAAAPAPTAGGLDTITREHWIPADNIPHCMEPGCSTAFTATLPPSHCFRCGLVYCPPHLSHQRTLDANAVPSESPSAVLAPVCKACFLWREDTSVVVGAMVSHTGAFKAARSAAARTRTVESNKLLRRLHRLALGPEGEAAPGLSPQRRLSAALGSGSGSGSLGDSAGRSGGGGEGSPKRLLKWIKAKTVGKRAFESKVVRWRPESEVSECGECRVSFSPLARKIHCRLCGNVFCSACTGFRVPYGILKATHADIGEVPEGGAKACQSCFQLATSRYRRARLAIQMADANAVPAPEPYVRYYQAMCAERDLINDIVPEYEAVTSALSTYVPPARSSDAEASRLAYRARQEERAVHLQKVLVKHFRKLEALGSRVAELDTDSPLVAKVQKNIKFSAALYMQHLFARKALANLSSRPKHRF